MTLPDCIDLANYTAIPTAQQVQCLRDHGIKRAIVGTSFGEVWDEQVAALELGGIECQEYQFPTRVRGTHRKVWLDCETPEATVSAISAVAPRVHGIYTRRGWWQSETGDWDIVNAFPHLKLWEAHYGDPPPAFVPFGGWTQRSIIQYHDSTLFCGLNVDLNVIEEVEDDMAERVWCSDRLQTWIVGKGGATLVVYPADDLAWKAIYGPHTKAMTGAELDKLAVK